ncbi:MAG: antibiotic biosynthesis monooxygenase [Pseudomonadota bacterium]
MAREANAEQQSPGATKIIDRIPRAGAEGQLEAAIRDITEALHRWPGLSSVHVIRPSPPEQPAYRIICVFDTEDHLRAWDDSDDYQKLISVADEFTEGEPQRTWLTGLETWFTLPVSTIADRRPPAFKMAITTFIALFPTILLVHALLALLPEFDAIPAIVGDAISVAIVVLLMTYLIMPRFTRLLKFWLYPDRS